MTLSSKTGQIYTFSFPVRRGGKWKQRLKCQSIYLHQALEYLHHIFFKSEICDLRSEGVVFDLIYSANGG